MGLMKKDKDKDKEKDSSLDKEKRSLFGRPKTKANISSPLPAAGNPYAVPSAGNTNPYANAGGANDPYAPKSTGNFSQPPTSSFGSLTLNSEAGGPPPSYRGPGVNGRDKSPVPPGGYGGGAPRYQSQGSYGQSGGYGSNPYGGGESLGQRPGGYGNLGRSSSQETMTTQAGKDKLFGGAPQRAAQQQQPPPESGQDNSYSNTGGYDSSEMPGGYGSAPARELTAEEQEEEDVQAAKTEIKFIKQQDVASTRNARRIAEQAEMTGRETLARLGQQGERIHNTEKNLDMASHQNRLADEKARELKRLNRSMFSPNVANPFTAKKRAEAAEAIALDKHQRERAIQEATRAEAYSSGARQQAQQRDINGNLIRATPTQRSLAERAKYQFEADSEDDEMENEIDDNLEAINRGARTLNQLGRAMGDELDAQNKHLNRIDNKASDVDQEIFRNTHKLNDIYRRG